VLAAQRELRPDLPVTFLVAADPYRSHSATIREVHLAADVKDEEEGNVVLVKAALDERERPALTVGGDVRTKIYCGRESLGYVWFHDVYEFLQTHVLFRL
ncbi:MAG: hypothetical protein J0M17_26680, partial [Planctomycetes bacterium]|nr:hypothetical protein [Planctomycetota bacterium]